MGAFNLPPGCTLDDIERACGGGRDPADECRNPACRAELTDDNDPDGYEVCSPACVWPAIAAAEQARRAQAEADAAEAVFVEECEALDLSDIEDAP